MPADNSPTVDQIVNEPGAPTVDDAMQSGTGVPENQPSAEDTFLNQLQQTHDSLISGQATAEAREAQISRETLDKTQAGYQSLNRGTFGSSAARWNPADFGSIARRDAFDLGGGDQDTEQFLINRDTNALPVVNGKTLHATPRVDRRFDNFPQAPASVRATVPRANILRAPDLRRSITTPKYPQLPTPTT